MAIHEKSCGTFLAQLASAEPVPGGGGASAYTGALGVALGSMVANLTSGKKKYAGVETDIQRILATATLLQEKLLDLAEQDAQVFAPLAKAYGLPKETEEERQYKAGVMEEALLAASLVPLEIMEQAYAGLLLQEELAEIGSRMALSDVGVGVQLLRAAILGGAMNIFINAKAMKDQGRARELAARAEQIITEGCELADRIYGKVMAALR